LLKASIGAEVTVFLFLEVAVSKLPSKKFKIQNYIKYAGVGSKIIRQRVKRKFCLHKK
jgi:hypothetical protein